MTISSLRSKITRLVNQFVALGDTRADIHETLYHNSPFGYSDEARRNVDQTLNQLEQGAITPDDAVRMIGWAL
jgi:hypothetical protein